MRNSAGFVQRLVAEQIDMRTCPELRFEADEVAKKVRETMLLLDENRQREPHLYEPEPKKGAENDEPRSEEEAQ